MLIAGRRERDQTPHFLTSAHHGPLGERSFALLLDQIGAEGDGVVAVFAVENRGSVSQRSRS